MSAFDAAFAVVLGHEGGFDAAPADPGNWTGGRVGAGALRGTKFGISAAASPDRAIAALTLDDARKIYRADYWDRVAADRLPPPLALLLFDAAVNNGPRRAVTWLQEALGVPADGTPGEATLAALARRVADGGATALCAEYLATRLGFMAALPSWRLFGHGWARRLCALAYQSVSFADGVP